MPAIIVPAEYDLDIDSFTGLSRDDPWTLRDGAGTVDEWTAAGLRMFTTADDFDATDFTANATNYAAKWTSKLESTYNYQLRQLAGQTGTQAPQAAPSGYFGDQDVVLVTDPTNGDAKLELGTTNASGYANILPTTGAFRIDIGVQLIPNGTTHLFGNGTDSSKFGFNIVVNDLRLTFASSGTGTRSLTVTLASSPAGRQMQLAVGRTSDNKGFIRYRFLGDADWTEVQSAALVNGSSVVYSIVQNLAFFNWTTTTSYASPGYWRYFAVWVGNPQSAVRDSWERFLTYSNALR